MIGCILAANAIGYVARFALMGWQSFAVIQWTGWIEVATIMVVGAAALFVTNRRALIALLAIMLPPIDPVFVLVGLR